MGETMPSQNSPVGRENNNAQGLYAGDLWTSALSASAMSTNSKRDEMEPKVRIRSSSATESSKPNNVYRKQSTMPGVQKPHIFSQVFSVDSKRSLYIVAYATYIRHGNNPNTSTATTTTTTASTTGTSETQTQVAPLTSSAVATAQHTIVGGGLAWSGNICHQRTQSLPLTAHPTTNAPPTDNTPVHPCSRATYTTTTAKRSNQSSKLDICCTRTIILSFPNYRSGRRYSKMLGYIDTKKIPQQRHPRRRGWRQRALRQHAVAAPYREHAPHPRVAAGAAPPLAVPRHLAQPALGGSPVSPPSVGCSTDSTGSSYSLADEAEPCVECQQEARYAAGGVSLTPDEAIVEEDCVESPCDNIGSGPIFRSIGTRFLILLFKVPLGIPYSLDAAF
ncbi:hypothetical protein NQ318_022483 [Aromia moschata]|uniref:Uncharacterized protein n=1 Tax=Aromia moschata TaxID=1265417 RepID=A0AAV8Z7L4_9CUCU|nr:hypothetical protein NQ318_022483 [Aromia moschata]